MIQPRLTPNIDLGHVVQVIGLVGVAVSAYYGLGNSTAEANRKIDDLKQQLQDVRVDIAGRFTAMQQQIAALPDVGARLGAVERRMTEIERARVASDARMQVISDETTRNSAAIESIQRASSLPLVSGKVR